ncbi:AAC(3) family N-acetyltransferase [Anaerolinea sp.]|uniref:AAC(3) family N-acetyltransferase n=1 Tax=Anaerolinea sp. TaxID=1872519 RepID=UPI002ACD3CAE|nr:AAC(3) family N-acetyltransferase [Anaerolinea sp.]
MELLPPISIAELTAQLLELGVKPGEVLVVHCAFSHVKPVEGGPLGLITALQQALGEKGTLVMPSMTDDDEQPFDVRSTPCRGMGIVADIFWRLPGVLRSDSPHAFAAWGAEAAFITAPHPVEIPHGLDSPIGRVYQRDGQVLLLGVGHTENTTLHLTENMAGVRYRRRKRTCVFQHGAPTWVEYSEVDHCCENFALADSWLDAGGAQHRGRTGYAEARLCRSRDVAHIVMEHLRENETVFLHPLGVDEQCDEAHLSLLSAPDFPAEK